MKSVYQQFEDWVREQDPSGEYNYLDANNCALGQFGKALGYKHLVGVGRPDKTLPPHIYNAIHPVVGEWTFGALAERLTQSRQALVPVRRGIAA